uniref:Uncharacterized protein n=1 Tax=Mycena chlorophos TaxID=658473 RepID=A0ABQ0L888_MYCCL|nr:predicted protein [Mycena chlorophos]
MRSFPHVLPRSPSELAALNIKPLDDDERRFAGAFRPPFVLTRDTRRYATMVEVVDKRFVRKVAQGEIVLKPGQEQEHADAVKRNNAAMVIRAQKRCAWIDSNAFFNVKQQILAMGNRLGERGEMLFTAFNAMEDDHARGAWANWVGFEMARKQFLVKVQNDIDGFRLRWVLSQLEIDELVAGKVDAHLALVQVGDYPAELGTKSYAASDLAEDVRYHAPDEEGEKLAQDLLQISHYNYPVLYKEVQVKQSVLLLLDNWYMKQIWRARVVQYTLDEICDQATFVKCRLEVLDGVVAERIARRF